MHRCAFALLLTSWVAAPARAEPAAKAPAVDQAAVDKAIERGLAFLKTKLQGPKLPTIGDWHGLFKDRPYEELLLYTVHHAGLPDKDPLTQRLLAGVLAKPLERTYNVALQVMALDAVDRKKYASRFAACAQWLVDTQCENGQWSYGEEIPGLVVTRGEPQKSAVVATGNAPAAGTAAAAAASASPSGTSVVRTLRHTRKGKAVGDNSNLQYALLALKVCLDNGVSAPRETFERAEQWWLRCQREDGAWGYGYNGRVREIMGLPGMTVGGIGSIAICRYGRRQDFKSSTSLKKAGEWLTQNWSVTQNKITGGANDFIFYYLYGLSRAGLLCGIEKFGPHEWYAEGAAHLLAIQAKDGSWSAQEQGDEPVTSTCFAILFLRRATRPIIYTESAGAHKEPPAAALAPDKPVPEPAADAKDDKPAPTANEPAPEKPPPAPDKPAPDPASPAPKQ